MPNIWGSVFIGYADGQIATFLHSGAFSKGGQFDGMITGATNSRNAPGGFTFDASALNPIYSGSDTVQPPAIQLIPQLRY